MKQQTIKEAISDESKFQEADYRLYLIRDGETVFYIGQSQNTHNRLLSHLGLYGRSGPSSIGQFIREHVPQSNSWVFEQYTLKECEPFILAYRATNASGHMQAFYRTYGHRYNVDDAEEALIKHYRPCFNAAMNPDPMPLPKRYQPSNDSYSK